MDYEAPLQWQKLFIDKTVKKETENDKQNKIEGEDGDEAYLNKKKI